MPINPYIAQGVQPIDFSNTLLNVARMKQADAESARRDTYQNALLQRQDKQFARQDKQDMQAQQEQEFRQVLARAEWILQSPNVTEALKSDPEKARELSGRFGFDVTDPNNEAQTRAQLEAIRQHISSSLGVGPKPQPGPVKINRDQGVTYVTQDGELQGSPHFPTDRAPPETTAAIREALWYATATPDQRAAYDATKRRGTGNEGFAAADTNAIRSVTIQAFGGSYDPISGNFSGIRKEDIGNMNKVTARASQIFQSNPNMPHAVAVQQAVEELKSQVPSSSQRAAQVTTQSPSVSAAVPTGLPEGVPEGSVKIGTSGGKDVYRDPSGGQWIVK